MQKNTAISSIPSEEIVDLKILHSDWLRASKEPIFGLFLAHFPNFCSKKSFFQKLQLCHAQLHKDLYHHAKIQGSLIIQFQENTQIDDRTEGRTDSTLSGEKKPGIKLNGLNC